MDWNSDGIPDIIFGQRRGGIELYAGNVDGTLRFAGHPVYTDGREISTSYNSSPWLVDWNGDGVLDLLLAGYLTDTLHGGRLAVLPGIPSPDGLVFDETGCIDLTSLCDLRRTTAQTGDLDGDGDWDLVLGCESGEVLYSENTGSDGEPRFTSSTLLWCESGPVDVFTRFAGCGRARPTVCDYDSDGTNDLLVGCHAGWIYVFRGIPADADTTAGSTGGRMLAVQGPLSRGVLRYFLALPAGECADLAVVDTAGRVLAQHSARPGGSGSLEVPGDAEGICFLSAAWGGGSCSRRLLAL